MGSSQIGILYFTLLFFVIVINNLKPQVVNELSVPLMIGSETTLTNSTRLYVARVFHYIFNPLYQDRLP